MIYNIAPSFKYLIALIKHPRSVAGMLESVQARLESVQARLEVVQAKVESVAYMAIGTVAAVVAEADIAAQAVDI